MGPEGTEPGREVFPCGHSHCTCARRSSTCGSAGQPQSWSGRLKPEYHSRTRPDSNRPWTLGLELEIPLVAQGKRAARAERSAFLADAADLDVANAAWMVRGRVRDRYLELQASRDVERFERAACALIGAEVKLSGGNHIAYAGTAQAQAQARSDLLLHSALAGIGIFLLLYIAFNNLLVLPAILLHFGRFAPADDVMRG